jgi:hypothetical protein
MTLTKDDLAAIEHLIDNSLETKLETKLEAKLQPRFDAFEKRIIMRIDDLDDTLSQQTAAGFSEVYTKIADLQSTVDRIEQVQLAEIMRNDHQDQAIKKIRKALHAA